MASSTELKLILNAVDNASKVIGGVEKSVGSMGKASQKAGDFAAGLGINFNSMVNPAMMAGEAVKFLAQQTWTMGKQGAVVIQTAESFDYLMDKVGATPGTLDRLREASLGTVDDMTLMSATATLLAGTSGDLAKSLADNTPQLLNIAKAAQKLNPSLGDTAFLYESISTGIKRNSPMILDNLGIVIKVGKANEAYAKALGKTVEQLTQEETAQALLNAVLEQGNTLIEQAGGNAESATDAFQRLDASMKNWKDTISTRATPAMIDLASALADGVDNTMLMSKAQELGVVSMNEIMKASHGVKISNEELTERIKEYTEAMIETEAQTNATADVELLRAGVIGNDLNPALQEELTTTLDLSGAMKNFSAELIFNQAAQNMDAEAAIALGVQLGVIDERTLMATERLAVLRDTFDANRDGMIDAKEAASGYSAAVLGLYSALDQLDGKTARASVIYTITNVGSPPPLTGSAANIEMRASGGPVVPGRNYIVGEDGPEMLTMDSSGGGMVTPITNNYFNLNMTSNAPTSTLIRDFAIMRSIA